MITIRFYHDVSWIRAGKHLLTWKTPKASALFSEREGYDTPLFRFRGYRLFYRRFK